mmetsp:Transcript_41566/g.68197  ORF Transcript_41566/g.68197 Transcript_41566/m.68197 type:complete len:276 (+) Transcript_41566:304-1131(+)
MSSCPLSPASSAGSSAPSSLPAPSFPIKLVRSGLGPCPPAAPSPAARREARAAVFTEAGPLPSNLLLSTVFPGSSAAPRPPNSPRSAMVKPSLQGNGAAESSATASNGTLPRPAPGLLGSALAGERNGELHPLGSRIPLPSAQPAPAAAAAVPAALGLFGASAAAPLTQGAVGVGPAGAAGLLPAFEMGPAPSEVAFFLASRATPLPRFVLSFPFIVGLAVALLPPSEGFRAPNLRAAAYELSPVKLAFGGKDLGADLELLFELLLALEADSEVF